MNTQIVCAEAEGMTLVSGKSTLALLDMTDEPSAMLSIMLAASSGLWARWRLVLEHAIEHVGLFVARVSRARFCTATA
jgi:hypothetical protein